MTLDNEKAVWIFRGKEASVVNICPIANSMPPCFHMYFLSLLAPYHKYAFIFPNKIIGMLVK